MDELVANFELSEGQEFDALFEIYASGTTWGNIDGDISNQIDLKEALDSKASNERVDNIVASIDDDIEEINTNISDLQTTVSDNYSILDNKIDSVESDLQGDIDTLENAVNTNTSNISTLNTTVSNLNTTVQSNYTILDTKINTTQTTLQGNIDTLSGTVTSNYNDLTQSITNNVSTLNTRITNEVSTLNGAISDEATARASADNNLQSQIDAITSASDVFDIVGTYAELQAYDISTVPVNDIIKVLVDSTHNNAATYYRCTETGNVKSWTYIGSEGAYYTKSEADGLFVEQTTTINGKPLSSNITLTPTDIGALPSSTQIGNGTITLTQGGNQKGTFTLNQTGNATIDFDAAGSTITVDSVLSTSSTNPVQNKVITTELNKKMENITSNDVISALGYTPYNSTNPNGFTSNVGTVTSVNNTVPDSNGNVTLNIPTPTVDQTYNASSTNAQSGVAIDGANFVQNKTTVTDALSVMGSATTYQRGINIGTFSSAGASGAVAIGWAATTGQGSVSLGYNNKVNGTMSVGLGYVAGVDSGVTNAIQLGSGTNSTSNTFNVGFRNIDNYTLLDGTTGLIPNARIKKQTSISSSSTNNEIPSAKCVYDAISGKQDTLVSGTNIKTVNNTSLLGSGNIDVLQNVAQGTNSLSVLGTEIACIYNPTDTIVLGNNIGINSNCNNAILLGSNSNGLCIGGSTISDTFTVVSNSDYYKLLDMTTGLIPDARLSSNIARTSDITGRNIGEIVTSTIPLTDAGLHLLDGALIQGSGSYGAFVDYIADLVTDYPDLFDTEANWQASVTQYGVCGKFVYDSVANTVRLPKITGIIEGTTDLTALGDLVEAGLPNIEGEVTAVCARSNVSNNGMLKYKVAHNYSYSNYSTTGEGRIGALSINANTVNPIYGNSTTVQPQAIKVLYYIVVATSTKTDIQVDIDEIATDLNGKADVDLSNVPTSKGILTESYVNGSSWYRVYSDGWCEQGGRCSATSQTVTYLKPFANTNYTVTGGLIPGKSTATYEHLNIGSLTTTSFYYTAYDSYQLMWQACGYIGG